MSDQPNIDETRTAYVVWVNTDRTEGRVRSVPIAYYWSESTAQRAAKGRDVQGTDGQIQPFLATRIGGRWHGPVTIAGPTKEDEKADEARRKQADALAKAKAAGLDDETIASLRGSP